MNHISLVRQLYADFTRGEIDAVLAALSPTVEWRANVDFALPAAARIPCYEPGRGRAFASAYFQRMDRSYEMHAFDIVSFLGGDGEVAVRINIDLTVRHTGRRVCSEVFHHWTIGADGLVSRFLDLEDTYAFVHAWGALTAEPASRR